VTYFDLQILKFLQMLAVFPANHYLLQQTMQQSRADLLVLSPEQYMSILQDKAEKNPVLGETLRKQLAGSEFGNHWKTTLSVNANNPAVIPVSQAATDARLITKTIQALGWAGVATYIKVMPNGKSLIILKGYAGHRDAMLQGTRLLDSNPKMIQMGLGMHGLKNVAKGGFILGIVVATGMETLDYIFNDEKTMFDLVGGIGVEAVKGGLAAAVGLIFGGLIVVSGAATTIVAVIPLAVMAVVVLVTSFTLNRVDSQYKIKEGVIAALKEFSDKVDAGVGEGIRAGFYRSGGASRPGFNNYLGPYIR
jgi:hypothetical protein